MKHKDMIGKIFKNNEGLEFKVNKFLHKEKTSYYFEVQFIESGSIRKAIKWNIINGAVRDNYHRNIFGIACKGNVSSIEPLFNKLAFKRWYAMLERCYYEKAIGYKAYGARGVTVNSRWLVFENYLEDIRKIDGFDEELYLKGEIQLDKDILYEGNKEYSFDKCIFVDKFTNKSNKPTEMRKFIAISPSGKEYEFSNQTECARQFNLTPRTIGKVLNKQLKTHKQWTFRYKEDK